MNIKKSKSFNIIKTAFKMLKNRRFSQFINEIQRRLHSTSFVLGLYRDLNVLFEDPEAKIDIHIRHLKQEDIHLLMDNGQLKEDDIRLYNYQMSLIKANLPTCYVAVNNYGEPCFMQSLIGSTHNDQIQTHFNGLFPVLKNNEALLEAAYMRPKFRGLRIMPAAVSRIARDAIRSDANRVITFIDKTNIPSLIGCKRAGFSPYIVRKDRWFLFRLKSTFEPLTNDLIQEYNINTGEVSRNQNISQLTKSI